MNKIRRIMTPVMAIVLVLCIGYFSGMSKTSAWFYDSGVIDSGDSFVFGNLSVNTKFVINHSVLFEATTKLADENEKFFDKAVNFDDVNVTNSGTVPARVYINIDVTNGAKGYRWFVYTDDMLINGSIKETIKANVKDLTKSGLDEYNSSKYVLLAPGESKVVRIASWVEYDDVSAELMKGESLTIATRIYMTATQNTDGIID
ncbi:unknown [Ruminococcus sp. CAG:563]|nr:unknown [Ruminococcus sp. CAG:563]